MPGASFFDLIGNWFLGSCRTTTPALRPFWVAQKIELDVLNDAYNRASGPDGTVRPKDPKIDELLKERGPRDFRWRDLNEAQKRLVALVPDTYVAADAARRFAQGEQLGLAATKALKDRFEQSQAPEERRMILSLIVDDVQMAYTRRGLDREAKRRAARRINMFGATVVLAMIAAVTLTVFFDHVELFGKYHILVVMACGLLGAYFSRLIAFQTAFDRLTYDELLRSFSNWGILVRLIAGVIGAVTVYFLIAGGLLGGQLFPNLNNILGQEKFQRFVAFVTTQWCSVQSSGSDPTVNNCYYYHIVSIDFAKLIVWSIVAGFSERIVPDNFLRLEASAQVKNGT